MGIDYTKLTSLFSTSTADATISSINYGTSLAVKADTNDWTFSNIARDTYATRDEVTKMIDEKLAKKPEVSPETTTKLDVRGGKIFVKHYKDGYFKSERLLLSDIIDIDVYGQTVVVTFADKTKTSAALDNEDIFSLEQGISICITKKLLGENGSSIYNKLIKKALKIRNQKHEAALKAEKEKEETKRRKEAALAKRNKKKLKRRAEQIAVYKEAIIGALEHMGLEKK